MHTFMEILRDHLRYRRQIFKLAKADLVKTYKGAALGWAWAIIRPTITIAVYYFAFSVGLRRGTDVSGFPFFLWLLGGIVPWFYITSVFTGGAASIRKYSHLVTKIRFPVSVIPTFTSMSHLVTNGIMTLIVMLIFIAMGYWPDLYWLQLPLYFVMMFVFFTVWALFAGMLSVISKDFLHLVQSSTTALFWMSGIMYDVSGINSPVLQAIMLYNPVTLIVNGYRNCFIHKVWFWENPVELRNYFIVLAIMMVLAVRTYKKLFRSIADVL